MSEPTTVYSVKADEDKLPLTPEQLDQLERQLIAALHAIWKATGKRKKVIDLTREKVLSY